MMSKKHVIIITSSGYPDKEKNYIGSIFVLGMVKELQKHVGHISIIAPRPYVPNILSLIPFLKAKGLFLQNYSDQNVSVYYPRYMRFNKEYNFERMKKSVLETIQKYHIQADIIHGHCLIPSGVISAQISRNLQLPCIITGHGQDTYKLPFVKQKYKDTAIQALKSAKKITTVSKMNLKCLEKLLPGVQHKSTVLYNGFDKDIFYIQNQQSIRKKLDIPKDAFVFIQAGRLDENKNPRGTLLAFSEVLKKTKLKQNLYLMFVGNDTNAGKYRQQLKQYAIDLGIHKQVYFYEQVSQNKLAQYYNAANVLLIPSFFEGNPTVLFEAMACGTAVVGSNISGIQEMIHSDKLGKVFEPKEPKTYVDAIIKIMQQPIERQYIASSVSSFSTKNIGRQFLSLYQEVIECHVPQH